MMTIPIIIASITVLSLGLIFFFIKKRKEALQRRLSFVGALKEKCEKMKTIGNLGSGFFANKVWPIYSELSELEKNFKQFGYRFKDNDLNTLAMYANQLNTLEAQQA